MRRIAGLWFAAFLAAAALCVPGLAPAAPEHGETALPPGYLSETLPNGLRVSILPAPDNPLVATQVWYHVGSANEDAGSRGLAHLFEHLMFGETKTRSKEDYSDYHHRWAGFGNGYPRDDQ